MPGEILAAREGFMFTHEGRTVFVRPGDTVRAGHPLLVGREDKFGPLSPTHEWEDGSSGAGAQRRGKQDAAAAAPADGGGE